MPSSLQPEDRLPPPQQLLNHSRRVAGKQVSGRSETSQEFPLFNQAAQLVGDHQVADDMA